MIKFPRAAWPALLALTALSFAVACGGETATDFEVELFDGARFRLSEQYADNVVVINFWYPSCPPCREEMPEFQRAYEILSGKPVQFLGLFVPLGFDTEETAKQFVEELELGFPFATDYRGTIAEAYGVEFYPTTWFIDRGGDSATTYVSALTAKDIVDTVGQLIED